MTQSLLGVIRGVAPWNVDDKRLPVIVGDYDFACIWAVEGEDR